MTVEVAHGRGPKMRLERRAEPALCVSGEEQASSRCKGAEVPSTPCAAGESQGGWSLQSKGDGALEEPKFRRPPCPGEGSAAFEKSWGLALRWEPKKVLRREGPSDCTWKVRMKVTTETRVAGRCPGRGGRGSSVHTSRARAGTGH